MQQASKVIGTRLLMRKYASGSTAAWFKHGTTHVLVK